MELTRVLRRALGGWLLCFALCGAPQVAHLRFVQASPNPTRLKNIIILIGDGMGFNQKLAGDFYQHGNAGQQVYDAFPIHLAMSTYSAEGHGYDPTLAWVHFSYVKERPTDSAAAATAMSTGFKTYNQAIGVDPDRKPVRHILELAEARGKATGVVSSVEFSHATPAGFVAHNPDRDNYAQIAQEMIISSTIDVIMGAGHPLFNNDGLPAATPSYKYAGGQATWEALVAGTIGGDADADGFPDPWTLIQTRQEFQTLTTDDTPDRVFGIPQVYTTLQQARAGDGNARPFEVPLTQAVPTLPEMTQAALNVLDNDPDGFFLMIEGGAIDWACHANQSGRAIEEQIDFNHAVEAVVDWVETHSSWEETLVIVTGDHETGYLSGPHSDPTWMPLLNNGQGHLPGMEWHSGAHTNSLIPFFAGGKAAAAFAGFANEWDPRRGRYIDNTEIAYLIFQWMDQEAVSSPTRSHLPIFLRAHLPVG